MLSYSSRVKNTSGSSDLPARAQHARRNESGPATNHRLADIDAEHAPVQRMEGASSSSGLKTNPDPNCRWYAFNGEDEYTPRNWSVMPGWFKAPDSAKNPDDPEKPVYMGPWAAAKYKGKQLVINEMAKKTASALEPVGARLTEAIERFDEIKEQHEITIERVQSVVLTIQDREEALKAAAEKAVKEHMTFPKVLGATGAASAILLIADLLSLPAIPWWLSLVITGLSTAYGVYLIWRWTHSDIPIKFSAPLTLANAGVMAWGLEQWLFGFIQTIREFGIGSAAFHAHPAFIALPFALALEHILLKVYEKFKKYAQEYRESRRPQDVGTSGSQYGATSEVTHESPLLPRRHTGQTQQTSLPQQV